MVATQGHVSQRSEEQPRPVKGNGQREMGVKEWGKGENACLVSLWKELVASPWHLPAGFPEFAM